MGQKTFKGWWDEVPTTSDVYTYRDKFSVEYRHNADEDRKVNWNGSVNVHYLHELQNLFYVLYKEELPINLLQAKQEIK